MVVVGNVYWTCGLGRQSLAEILGSVQAGDWEGEGREKQK